MTTSINTATKTPVSNSVSDVHDAAPPHDPQGIKDNLSEPRGVVIKSDKENPANVSLTFHEAPELATPDSFKNKKSGINIFQLTADNAITNLNIKKHNFEVTQHNLEAVQKDQKKNNEELDKKVNEQADKQTTSASKSGFLGVFNKVFTGLQIVAGVAALLIPGMQAFGVCMLVGAAASLAASSPTVINAIGSAFTSVLEKCGVNEADAKKWGSILATATIVLVEIGCAIGAPLSAGKTALSLLGTVMKTLNTTSSAVQGAGNALVGIQLGVNNADLAKITKAVDMLQSNSSFYDQHINMFMNSIQETYKEMSSIMSNAVEEMDSVPTFQVA